MSPAEDYWESEESGGAIDPTWILGFLGRNRWWIAGVTVLLALPALLLPGLLDDVYEASARVQVQARPEVMDVGSSYTSEGPINRAHPLSREQSIALSDAVLGRVVEQLPEPEPPEPPSLLRRLLVELGLRSPRSPLTAAQIRKGRIEMLRLGLRVELSPSGEFLDVVALGSSAQDATFLANAVAEAVVEYNKQEQNEAYDRSVTWINSQVFELRERIAGNSEQLDRHVAEYGIVADSGEAAGASNTRAALISDLSDAEIELQALRARMRELPSRVSSAEKNRESDPELVRVQQRFEAARAALDEARSIYTPTHPEVRRREAALRAIEQELAMWGPMAPFTTSGVSETDQQEYRSLVQQEAALRARRAALQRRLDEISGPDVERSRARVEYDRLNRQLTLDRGMLDMMMRKREEIVLGAAADFTRARVLEPAVAPLYPVGPPRMMMTLAGLALALGAGLGCALVRDYLDQSVRDPSEAKRLLGAPVIAMVPLVQDGTPPERQSEGSPASLPAESYRNLRTGLLFSSSAQGFTTLVVTSGLAGEGKTTVSTNLASSFSQAGRSVLLIDADMRVPRVHRVFGVSASPGLADLLRGDASFDAAVRRPVDGRFDVVTAGLQPPNPSELIASPEFAMLLSRVRGQYDMVIVDSPVLLGVSDTQLLASQADATLLVQRPGLLNRRALREMRTALDQAGARVLGVVFNQVPRTDRHFYPAYLESPYLSEGKGRQSAHG